MKNTIAIVIVIAIIAISFSSASAKDKERMDVSEKAVKTVVVKGAIDDWCQKIGVVDADEIHNVRIEAKSQQNTRVGRLTFYAITAEMKVQNHHFNVVLFVWTGENDNNQIYSFDASFSSPKNSKQMQQYYQALAKHKKAVVEKTYVTIAGLELATSS